MVECKGINDSVTVQGPCCPNVYSQQCQVTSQRIPSVVPSVVL